MSKKISFMCNDEAVDLYISLIEKLQESSGDRKIRIGGSEYDFYSDIDKAGGLLVDDTDYYSLSDFDQREFEVVRANFIASKATAVEIEDESELVDSDSDSVEDDEEVACLQCGSYHPESTMDSEGLCCDCSDEEPETSNLTNYAEQKVNAELSENIRMNRIFTAFDITKRIRTEGVKCKHEDVKQLVHNAFLNGEMDNYGRSLIDVGTAIQPWLYCPVTRSASEYNHGDN